VAQCSFSKCIAKKMCFESGFELCDYYRGTSYLSGSWLAAAGIIAKSRLSVLRVNPWYFWLMEDAFVEIGNLDA